MASYFKSRNKRQDKRQRQLDKLARWRKRKAEIRQERIAAGLLEREPRMERYYRFELGIRDTFTGEIGFVQLKSTRDAAKRISLVLKFCQ